MNDDTSSEGLELVQFMSITYSGQNVGYYLFVDGEL
jgi:hypothetical protein